MTAEKATMPKAAIMTTLAALVAAWEGSTGKHMWRNPDRGDARVLRALIEWGYQPSDVERLLIGETTGASNQSADATTPPDPSHPECRCRVFPTAENAQDYLDTLTTA